MNELDGFRAEIDRIDTELARLLELRFDLCEEIGRYKRMNGLPIENCEREKELVAARTEGMLSHRSRRRCSVPHDNPQSKTHSKRKA